MVRLPVESSLLTKDRENGYREAMLNARIAIEDDWIISGDLTIAGARSATKELLSNDTRPSAIFCANDEMALGALHEIKAAGLKVPDDISVMGFDNSRYAEVSDPPLTTVAQPGREIGVRTALRMIKSSKPEIIPHQLIIRNSVGKA